MKGLILLGLVVVSCVHALPKRFLSDGKPLTVSGNCLRDSACSGCSGHSIIDNQEFCCNDCHGGISVSVTNAHATCHCTNH
uniref:Uncharacterized protein n=1 Tax=Pinctada fucata TaxID=50426 RepID=A0A194ANK0_PINFU